MQITGSLVPVSLTVSVAYTDAKYTETVESTVSTGAPQIIVRDGDTLGVPEWQFSASAQYDFTIADQRAYLRADYQYTGDYLRTTGPGTVTYDAFGYQADPIRNLDMRLGMNFEKLEVALFGTNLTNEDNLLTETHPGGSILNYLAMPRPREIGLTVSFRY